MSGDINEEINKLDLGKAGEHLVCFDLLTKGYQAYLSDQGLPYDVVLDFEGKLFRVQVKATTAPKDVNRGGKNPRIAYMWEVRRRGNKGRQRLDDNTCDIVALVALDAKEIAYFPVKFVGQTMYLRASDSPNLTHTGRETWARSVNHYPIEHALSGDEKHFIKQANLKTCVKGHEYTEENTGKASNGSRYCKECSRIKGREAARRKRAARKAEKGREVLSGSVCRPSMGMGGKKSQGWRKMPIGPLQSNDNRRYQKSSCRRSNR